MKRAAVLFLAMVIVIGLTACQKTPSNPCDLSSGTYCMVGEFEEMMTPYLYLNFDDYTFSMGAGLLGSYAEIGSFVVEENKIIATSQSTAFVFEIKDKNALVLVDNGDDEYFKMPEKAEFVFRDAS